MYGPRFSIKKRGFLLDRRTLFLRYNQRKVAKITERETKGEGDRWNTQQNSLRHS